MLCDLRGLPRAEAAKALGIPEGTLSSRLANGRKKLADRLARRGVAVPAVGVLAVLAADRAVAGIPEELVAKTCGLVADWSAGAAVPAPVARLAHGEFPMRKILLLGVVGFALGAAGVVFAARPTDPPQRDDPPKPPAVVAEAQPEPKPAPKPAADPKPDEKAPVAYGLPRMRKAIDLSIEQVEEMVWSPDGKRVAIRGAGAPRAANGPSTNVVAIVDRTPREKAGVGYERVVIPRGGRLVGFTSDGKQLITDRREYSLVSGFHQLTFWEEVDSPGGRFGGGPGDGATGKTFQQARTVDLDADRTFGYALAPDGKTYRTVHQELVRPGVIGRREVREVSTETGQTLRALLGFGGESEVEGDALSADGRRYAVLNSKDQLSVWDVDTGKRLWTHECKFERYRTERGLPVIHFSSDGSRVVCSRPINRPVVLYGTTGERLPDLDGAGKLTAGGWPNCFTHDGRLLVLSGQRHLERMADGPKGFAPGVSVTSDPFSGVWDTDTGKLLRSWDRTPRTAFSPAGPVLAILEDNGAGGTRLGLWDFSTEVPKK